MTNLAHLHLLLNHLPIVGCLFAGGLLVAGLVRRDDSLTVAAKVALVLVALTSIPAYFTGEPAEEQVEDIAGISRKVIHEHEEAGEAAFVVMLMNGALAAFLFFRRRDDRRLHLALAVVTLVSFGLMARTGNLGGKIRHPEIDAATAPVPTSPDRTSGS